MKYLFGLIILLIGFILGIWLISALDNDFCIRIGIIDKDIATSTYWFYSCEYMKYDNIYYKVPPTLPKAAIDYDSAF